MVSDVNLKEGEELFHDAVESVEAELVEDDIILSHDDLTRIAKEQIENSKSVFCEMSAEQVMDLFTDVSAQGVDVLNNFDYRLYTAEYYREKFPGFDPRFYQCLEKASHEKFADQTPKVDKFKNYTYENGEFVISFGGDDKKDLENIPLDQQDDGTGNLQKIEDLSLRED